MDLITSVFVDGTQARKEDERRKKTRPPEATKLVITPKERGKEICQRKGVSLNSSDFSDKDENRRLGRQRKIYEDHRKRSPPRSRY